MSRDVWAIRGATTVERDEPDHITERVQELLGEMFARNELDESDVISLFLTATSDIRSMFPAAAARKYGLDDVPLIGAQELDVEGALPLCIRLIAHVNTDKRRSEMRHVFMQGARTLRADIAD